MGISSALQWWDEWQLSVLVLCSLAVRCFLALAAGRRKSRSGRIFRFSIWLSYLGGDALAIYALATLLNIQKKVQQSSSSAGERGSLALQVLWAPIMLMHLGGLSCISGYNIEDNELWRRHILTSVSQVAIALYVFCKLWPSSADKRLLAAAVLLFIPGILKCVEKPLALKRSSFYNLVSQPTSSKKSNHKKKTDELNLKNYIKVVALEVFKDPQHDSGGENKSENPQHDSGGETKSEKKLKTLLDAQKNPLLRPDRLFVDLAPPYCERFEMLKYFKGLNDDDAHTVICAGISNTFDLLYTKQFAMESKDRHETLLDIACSFFTSKSSLLAPAAAVGLLHSSHKEAYKGSDVKISLVLLYVTLFVELWSCGQLSNNNHDDLFKMWRTVSQHNLIALFARKKRHTWLTGIAGSLGCTDLLDQILESSSTGDSKNITTLVYNHVIEGWERISSIAKTSHSSSSKSNDDADELMMMSYWDFGDRRGHGTLVKYKGCERVLDYVSLDMAFDETVLIWHLATDFCSFTGSSHHDSTVKEKVKLARLISNYMMHLLFANPEMLMPGSRRDLCTVAYGDIGKIFDHHLETKESQGDANARQHLTDEKDVEQAAPPVRNEEKAPPLGDEEGEVTRRLFQAVSSYNFSSNQDDEGTVGKSSFIYKARELAKVLQELETKQMWDVMEGVWVEMLCFSATRCRGYLHAKSLGSGGEYLTFVWLLMAHAGMETFPERQQRVYNKQKQQPDAAVNGEGMPPTQGASQLGRLEIIPPSLA